MIIDFHAHIFPDHMAAGVIDKLSRLSRSIAFTDGTLNGLTRSMHNANIDLSIVLPVATNDHQVKKLNDISARNNEQHSNVFMLGAMHPDFTNYAEELSRIAQLGLKGIKIHPVYQETNIDDIKFLRILDRAAEVGLFVVTHAGADIGFPGVEHCSPSMIKHAFNAVGNFNLIAAHMGGWKNWDESLTELANTNVFVDTAFSTEKIIPRGDCQWNENDLQMLDADRFMQFKKAFGADRIIFGTDTPWSDQKRSLEFINQLPLSVDDKNKILGGNAAQLLNIQHA